MPIGRDTVSMTALLAWCFVVFIVLLVIRPLSFSWLKRREQNRRKPQRILRRLFR
jgi:hypothetical protein